MRRELEDATTTARALPEQGLPKELSQYYVELFVPVNSDAATLIEKWSEQLKSDLSTATVEAILKMTEELVGLHTSLEKNFKEVEPKKKQLKAMVKQSTVPKEAKAEPASAS